MKVCCKNENYILGCVIFRQVFFFFNKKGGEKFSGQGKRKI